MKYLCYMLAVVLTACAALPSPAPSPASRDFMAAGLAALEGERWAEAAAAFAAAHEAAAGVSRTDAALFRAYALYREADSLLQQGRAVEAAGRLRVVGTLEAARSILREMNHPLGGELLRVIDAHLRETSRLLEFERIT